MLLLNRIVHNTIWGGPKISRLAGVEGNRIGHLYSLYCRKDVSNEILNGQWRGRCLNEVFPLFKAEVGMGDYEFFPLTLALTEARENLSIQVHPDDEAAGALENSARGKRESWYFIDAPTSGTIINGCTCRDKAQQEMMIANGQFLEMADVLPVGKGDYVFVEPGTLHAITAGSLVFEIEEGSDFTYRFYDYDRVDSQGNKRELHVAKAAECLRLGLKSTVKVYNDQEIVEKTYTTRLIENLDDYTNLSNALECFTFVEGNLWCDSVEVPPGSTILMWPGESLPVSRVKLAFVSRLNTTE